MTQEGELYCHPEEDPKTGHVSGKYGWVCFANTWHCTRRDQWEECPEWSYMKKKGLFIKRLEIRACTASQREAAERHATFDRKSVKHRYWCEVDATEFGGCTTDRQVMGLRFGQRRRIRRRRNNAHQMDYNIYDDYEDYNTQQQTLSYFDYDYQYIALYFGVLIVVLLSLIMICSLICFGFGWITGRFFIPRLGASRKPQKDVESQSE